MMWSDSAGEDHEGRAACLACSLVQPHRRTCQRRHHSWERRRGRALQLAELSRQRRSWPATARQCFIAQAEQGLGAQTVHPVAGHAQTWLAVARHCP